MTDFVFTPLVNSPHADVVSAALGATATDLYSDVDVGQAVKVGIVNNYVPAVDGNDLEGVVVSVMGNTVNDGFSFGSVQKNKRVLATVAANEAGTVDPGDLVICGTAIALGTANSLPNVKVGAPASHFWRCIRIITGTGVAGDSVLIERI